MSQRAHTPEINSTEESDKAQLTSISTEELDFAQPMEEEVVEEESSEEYQGFLSPPSTPMISEEDEEEDDSDEIVTHMNPEFDPDETRKAVELLNKLGPRNRRPPSPPPIVSNTSHRIPPSLLNIKASRWTGVHHWPIPNADALQALCLQEQATYAVFYKEICPKTGKEHHHSLVLFNKTMSAHAVFRMDPNAHWEVVRGRLDTIYKYISKDGEKVFEYGNPPILIQQVINNPVTQKITQQQRFQQLVVRAQQGDVTIMQDMLYARFRAFFDQLLAQAHHDVIYDGEMHTKNLWIHGPAGTGKSKMVWQYGLQFNKAIYVKILNKWWDGYNNEPIVLMDDVTPDSMKFLAQHMKNWADRYPITVEVKGGSRRINTADFHLIVTRKTFFD